MPLKEMYVKILLDTEIVESGFSCFTMQYILLGGEKNSLVYILCHTSNYSDFEQ